MIQYHIPQPPLADFVALFWLYEDETPRHAKERRLPTGTVELVIQIAAPFGQNQDRHQI